MVAGTYLKKEIIVDVRARKWIYALIWGIAIVAISFYLWSALHELLPLEGFQLLFLLSLGVVGTLILNRQPYNPVGWTFFAAFCYLIASLILEASLVNYLDRFSEDAFVSAATLGFIDAYDGEVVNVTVWFSLLIFAILYFPNGELPSPRWRYLVQAVLVLLFLKLIRGIFDPELSSELFPDFENPLAIPLAADIIGVSEIALIFVSLMAPLLLAFRFRRARGVERQQIKWPLFSALLGFIGITGFVIGTVLFGGLPEEGRWPTLFLAVAFLEPLSVLSFPITVGIAILRYRLYDIDVIIRRTLVYTVLTGTLALVYLGSVLLLQMLFGRLLQERSSFIIVVSTLLIAALFAPLRRRVQDAIDRRFYRRNYDAAQALDAFAAIARNEVDLERLTAALVTLVDETMQPEHVSLWLKTDPEKAKMTRMFEDGATQLRTQGSERERRLNVA